MPTIGVLLDPGVFDRVPKRKTGHEKLVYYERAAKEYNMKVMYLCLPHMDLKKQRAKGWIRQNGRYRLVERPIPEIIHNRAMPFAPKMLKKLKKLRQIRKVYNPLTRYDKYRIHKLMYRSPALRVHLPQTVKFSRRNIVKMKLTHNALFVKPVNSSVGKGIIRTVRLQSGKWRLQKAKSKKLVPGKRLYPELRRWIGRTPYLIQEAVPLATYKGNPYDIRVSVQRSDEGRWKVTGMIGKVAKKGKFLTNVAQGGKVKPVHVLLNHNHLPAVSVRNAIEAFSLATAEHLSNHLKGLSDLGLDIGVTSNGDIRFIEMNARDQRYTFQQAGMRKTFYQTYHNPIRYGRFLLDKGESRA